MQNLASIQPVQIVRPTSQPASQPSTPPVPSVFEDSPVYRGILSIYLSIYRRRRRRERALIFSYPSGTFSLPVYQPASRERASQSSANYPALGLNFHRSPPRQSLQSRSGSCASWPEATGAANGAACSVATSDETNKKKTCCYEAHPSMMYF